MQNRYLLRAFYLTGFGIAAMAEPFLIGLATMRRTRLRASN
jgi:hypothetical protein